MGRIEIPQRSSLLLSAGVLSSCRKHGRHQAVKRREFITMLGGAAAGWPIAADAQQTVKVYRLGLLGGSPPNSRGGRRAWEGFFQGMRELGYVEGQNIRV